MKDIKHYWENKDQRKLQAIEHNKLMQSLFSKEIKECIKNSEIITYKNIDYFPVIKKPNIVLKDIDTVSALLYNESKSKIGVLNFASYKYPGGGYMAGSKAQEECLCHESFLYNVISTFEKAYYEPHRSFTNKGLYTSVGIYSPDVVFMRYILDGQLQTVADVITIACPNKGPFLKYNNGSEEENTKALDERIKFVLETASSHKVKVLILGAYGCGVFQQNAKQVATIFKKYLDKYDYGFEEVIFAIPAKDINDINYKEFNEVLN